jgi:hypothetical protein
MVPKRAARTGFGRAGTTFAPPVRALIVTNMYPSAERPELGSFVADQVAALRRTGEAEIEVFAFAPNGYLPAAKAL